ncbi:beta-1,6-N-acetylglucosaminyltransferase [Synechocystis sp. PCC 7509]|uniref:beta-1,6-N-acetylglucosaminyltransferase n=1 Tax=Synechocystis sp. PCC 7509 TaxID=927677 RepID=UPI00192B4DA9|nr:beta-1,6-N-acetylglucosaminyltransferase [Synechocystis sp. PCC 7509]
MQTIKNLSPHAQVLIGHDFTSCFLDFTPLRYLSDVHLLKIRRPGIRGDFSLLQPYLQAIDWLFANNSDFDWLFYLSGQDYPTQPLSKVENFLDKTDYDGFIHYANLLSPASPWKKEEVIKRYFYQHYRLPKWVKKFLAKVLRFHKFIPMTISIFFDDLVVGMLAKKTPFHDNFLCYGGSQWHTLSRKCVGYIKTFIANNKSFVKYYQKTLVPDESFIQTILINNQSFNFCNDHKRYIDFTGTNEGRPRLLTNQDYEILTNGNFHFARKFEQDTKILDMLEAYLFANF